MHISTLKNRFNYTIILFLTGILLTYSTSVRSAEADKKLDITERTHFIVLIRDTGMMKKKFYPLKMIVDTLPKLLFEGAAVLKGNTPLKPTLPVYHPEHDHLSVVFVAIHKDVRSTACKNDPALSALPKHLFQWQPVKQGQNQAAFTRSLRQWIKKSCRAQGYVSSNVLAEMMSLSYVEKKMANENSGKLFSKTILIFLGNDAYYGGANPSRELGSLKQIQKVRDIKEAAQKIDDLNKAFHIVTPPDWVFTIHPKTRQFQRGNIDHGNTLRYRVAEIQTLDNQNKFLDYHQTIKLDRVAMSNDKLKLVQPGGAEIILGIRHSKRLQPDKLELAFADKNGNDWQIGQHALPRSTVIDIRACKKSKKCQVQNDGTLHVPLLGVVMNDPHLRADDPALTPGQIRFKIRFRYNAEGVYTHHYVDTKLKTIDIQPVKPLVISESLFSARIFPQVVLDNKTLAAQYDPSKDSPQGLTQDVARARLEAEKTANENKAIIGVIVSVLILLIIAWLLLYKFKYHRRFKPKLEWEPAKKIDINFNQQPGAIIKVGVLTVRNEGEVPWFGKLFGNKDYPDYKVEFFLNYSNDQLRKCGVILSEKKAAPFYFTEKKTDTASHSSEDKKISEKAFYGALKQVQQIDPKSLFGSSRERNTETTPLVPQIEHRVSHETPIYVFFATDVIEDFKHSEQKIVEGQITVTFGGKGKNVQIAVEMLHDNKPVARKEIEFNLEVMPEQPKPPRVTYQPNAEKLYFQKDKSIRIGTLRFESQAEHYFAKPFKGRFNIQSYKNNLSLENNPVALLPKGEEVEVRPRQTSEVDVVVFCDGESILNPEPRQDYTFNLTGQFAHGSEQVPHTFTLLRDPTRADIALEIVQFKNTYSLYWQQKDGEQKDGEQRAFEKYPSFRLRVEGREEAEGHSLDNGILNLAPNLVKFDKGTPAVTIFEIHLGNTGKSGQGWVKLHLTMELKFQPQVRMAIKLHQGYQIENSLHLITSDHQGEFNGDEMITVKEGEPDEKLVVQINAGQTIQDIVGGRIDTDSGSINAFLDIEIQDDDGQKRSHELTIVAPIGVEKLPHPNWLCIDFGTSAIVAAVGTQDKPYFLPLQKLVKEHDPALNLEDYDPNNTERGTDFLPSQIVCDADLRQSETQDDKIRKGYPRYQPASLNPGDPDFIGLPATTPRLREYPGRVIFSLKSWLAQPSETISLPERVKFYQLDNLGNIVTEKDEEDNHKPVEIERPQLPLKDLVESGFAALAEGYIIALDVFEKGGQLILSHPNTFTAFHKKKLHDIAWKALNQRLGIALPERLQLISESDAVAYHYCRQRMLEARHCSSDKELQRILEKLRNNNGWECLLVYDFGAGTLDLSLVHIRWNQEGTYPEQWQVENRLGVPIAGNHLDSLLARLIDGLLRDESVLNPEVFEYQYPVVDKQLKGDSNEQLDHRQAVYKLWQNIREVKHSADWQEGKPFRVLVGSKGGTEVVRYKENAFLPSPETAPEVSSESRSESQERSEVEKPVLETDGDQIYLKIPAVTVHNYPPLQAFIEFVADTVVNELLGSAEIAAQQVNTVVVSGRGALWQGLRERVWNKFPERCEKPKLDKEQVKNAVVSGAIAWQELSEINAIEPKIKPRLAILREQDNFLTPEEDWEKEPIDLRATSTFRLVQISHQNPDPKKDFNSLHRHFYILLDQIRRETMWKADPWLFVSKQEQQGQTVIKLQNKQGQGFDFATVGSVGTVSSTPPWPIGNILLEPDNQ
ncbi:MAG: hypothetical protein DRR08_04585 [Candidatus Parabeggiatoa sp. nov. 2]|nr:MAG: hypothetical protein DRR08_04585 [Gammaproteobacteria bacterium]